MVNMNAADDKENIGKSNKLNGVNVGAIACSTNNSPMCRPPESGERVVPQPKTQGVSLQSNDCNNHPITNGAYPKINSTSCGAASAVDTSGPSGSWKNSSPHASSAKLDNVCKENESKNDLLLKKNTESHSETENHLSSSQRLPKPKDRNACNYNRDSSSDGSEDEECCIYTYKGDSNQMADLPSSFFRLDLMPSRPNANSRNSSPDMDYLEMDFDPGPSNDRYSSSDSEGDDERENQERFALEVSLPRPQENYESAGEELGELPPTPISPLSTPSPVPQPSPEQPHPPALLPSPTASPTSQALTESEDISVQPTYCYCITNKLSSTLFNITNKLSACSIDENFNEGESAVMVWKEQEAKEKQVSQIATSACGATAVINTLLGLNVPFTVSAVKQCVATRLRNETAPVAEYLFSRCDAGATHEDMIRGLQDASLGAVYARFFPMYPQRSISLTSWLSHWMRKGAVPIATLNLQRGVHRGPEIPDMWHHQMVYGMGVRGVYLTNPLEVHSETELWPQLASPSVLLVRREDVLSRWSPDTPLHPLIHPSLPAWRKMNVLGQVANLIREANRPGSQSTSHITIPASYRSGVTLAVLRDSDAYEELRFAPELPIDPFAAAAASTSFS